MSGLPSRTSAAKKTQTYLRLHSIDVYVRDQERSLRFYCEQLGFHLAFDARLQSGQRCVAVAPPDGTAVLTLIQPDPDSPDFQLIGRASRAVFVTEDVLAKVKEWGDKGVRFRNTPRLRRVKYEKTPQDRPVSDTTIQHGQQEPIWGQVIVRFEDIDRNSFSLVSFDEVSRAVELQRRIEEDKREAERRLAQELEYATQVQARLFPQSLPQCRTLDYAGACVQARRVGGDYYDFLNLGRERLGLVIGDISGKGMAAALLMANLQASLRSQCAVAVDEPQAFFRSVNQRFCESTTPGAYATVFFAEYCSDSCRLRYVNCGHLPGLVLRERGGAVERLSATSTVVGLFEEWDCEVAECQIGQGDTLALYTDGITEAFNERGDEFGEENLVQSLRRHQHLPAEDMINTVLADVQQFSPDEQHDDVTLIIAKCDHQPVTTTTNP
jgi:serine phosphatase RsbU (regulator of sigma subunit)/catechol 2,3-dioxygenase-like lactoylglutathione lyase family enzyme